MKINISAWFRLIGVFFVVIIISGCSGGRLDLVKCGDISIEKIDSKHVNITWCSIYKENGDYVLTGAIKRRENSLHPVLAHIDASIISQDGKVIDEKRTNNIYVPIRSSCRGLGYKRFELRIIDIPTGAMVRLVAHSESHENL